MKVLAALLTLSALGLEGCAGRGCSEEGGYDGVRVDIPRALFVSTGSVAIEVCDADDCASAAQALGAVPEGAVGRSVSVTFKELGREFEPGLVIITVELTNANGKVIAAAQQDVQLTRSYPNGKSCDGEGYVVGAVNLTSSDRL